MNKQNHISIKICGLTRPQDIDIVCAAGADQAGFVFADSQRQLSILQAASLVRLLPSGIEAAGIFVNAAPSLIVETVEKTGLSIIQLHGSETENYIEILRKLLPPGSKIWKSYAFPSKSSKPSACSSPDTNSTAKKEQSQAANHDSNFSAAGQPDAWILDSNHNNKIGGSGETFDWLEARRNLPNGKIILAGGLNPENVHQAIRLIRPDGVDCSSGVETAGRKDKSKILAFCQEVRNIKLEKEI